MSLSPAIDGPVNAAVSDNPLDFAGLPVDEDTLDLHLADVDFCNAREVGLYWQNLILKNVAKYIPLWNSSGGTLTKGTLFSVTGYDYASKRVTVVAAQANDLTKPAHGVIGADVANGASGYGFGSGRITNIDTHLYSNGQKLYLSDTPGLFSTTPGTNEQLVGGVILSDSSTGSIEFFPYLTHWTNLGSNLNSNARVNARLNSGSVVGTRRGLNLIAGANISIGIADNAASETLDITIAATVTGVGGSGTTNTLAKFTAATSVGNSTVTDDGTTYSPTKRVAEPKVDVTPTGNANDVNLGDGVYIRYNPNGAYDLTGIANGTDGRIICIHNVSGNITTIKYQSASSSASNRIICPNYVDYLLMPDGVVYLRWDTTTSRWRIEENTKVSSLPRGHIDGLILTRTSGTVITTAAGACRDSTDKVDIRNTAAFAKTLGNTWAAGASSNGLDTGAVATSTWYHVYAIRKDSDGTFDVLFSVSASAPTMPTGYTYKRRIGSVYRDSGGNILTFTQIGDEFFLSASILDVNSTNPGASAFLNTLTVPLGIQVWAIFEVTLQDSAVIRELYMSCPDQSDETPVLFTANAPLLTLFSTTAVSMMAYMRLRTNTSSQVRGKLAASGANTIVRICTYGWVDIRGKDS